MFKFIVLMLISFGVHANGCVVLLYHYFSDATPKSTSISPELFESHLQYLQDNQFKVLSLKDMLGALDRQTLPEKCVVLTADDAYQSIYKNAYLLLQKYKMPMSVFVATDPVDKKYPAMMSWSQMREIQGENIAFYNHSSTHPYYLNLHKTQIKTEIEHAQNRLKQELNVVDKILAYPYGEANPDIFQQIKDMGYIAFGQHSGVLSSAHDRQNLPRFPMSAHFAKMESFMLKVNTLPMPLVYRRINTVVTDNNPPMLNLTFKQPLSKDGQKQFNCFADGGVEIEWHSDKAVSIIAKKPLSNGHSKYNCTLPSDEKGRYYWHSVQWIKTKI